MRFILGRCEPMVQKLSKWCKNVDLPNFEGSESSSEIVKMFLKSRFTSFYLAFYFNNSRYIKKKLTHPRKIPSKF